MSHFSSTDIPDKAYGGEHQIFYTNERGEREVAHTQNPSNAYMLVYERSKKYKWRRDEDNDVDVLLPMQDDELSPEKAPRVSIMEDKQVHNYEIPVEIRNLIQDINAKQW